MDPANELCTFCLINESGILNVAGTETFVKKAKLAESGLSYATVSIMGPQSSGKSTLLNHLFGTNFREMNAFKERCQTTKGIWLAKCPGIEPCTIVLDLEGSDGQERGEDDTAFEKQAALFAFAVSDIVIINMWCTDLGRVQGSSKPLLRTVFEVMGRLFKYHKTTLWFVLRDKTSSPMKILESLVWNHIQKIWDSVAKPHQSPLTESFNVNITALSGYEDKEGQFNEEVANLRQRFFNSITLGGLAGDRRDKVPASGLSCSLGQIWETIKKCKDLNLPDHKVMVANVRCEEIAKEKRVSFIANKDWCQLEKNAESHPVPNFGKSLTLILNICLSEYDTEATYYDEGVRTEKRRQLKDNLLQIVQPAHQSMLEHICSRTLDEFKEAFDNKLRGGTEFSVAVHDCTKSFMAQFDEGCTDAIIDQAKWDLSKLREKLQHDIHAHVAVVCSSELSKLLTHFETKIDAALSGPVDTLLVRGCDDTWQKIRQRFWHEVHSSVNKLFTALSGFNVDKETTDKMVEKLEGFARGVIQVKARQVAGSVLTHMKNRFERFFSHDSDSNLRHWSGKEDIQALRETGCSASLKLLSIMAAIRLEDDADDIEKTLLALVDNNGSTILCDPFVSDTWEKVPSSKTLITPLQCKDIWRQFIEYSQLVVTQAQEASKGARHRDLSVLATAGIATTAVASAAAVVVTTVTTGGVPVGIDAVGPAVTLGKTVVDAVGAVSEMIRKYRRSKP